MPQKPKRKKRFFYLLIIGFLSFSIFLLLLIFVLFNFYKDDIGRELLLRVSKIQKGELIFKDISVNPFVHFPNVSLAINDIDYYEYSAEHRAEDSIPIIKLEKLFVAFNVVELIKGNVTLSKILLENGKVTLVTYADSSLNLLNTFDIKPDTSQNRHDTLQEEVSDFELNLEKIVLKNVGVFYNNMPDKNYSALNIQTLDASLNYWPDTIKCHLNSSMIIDEAKFNGGLTLSNKHVQIGTSFVFDRNSHKVIIDPSNFSYGNANLAIEGHIDLLKDGFIDLVVVGVGKDFSILNLFLENTVVNSIDQGELSFSGTVKGMLFKGIPQTECSFSLSDVEIKIPNTKQSINKLSLRGSFQSGNEKDFSEAQLKINEMSAQLPGGNLEGAFSVMNFQTPIYDLHYKMKTDIDGFENIINLSSLDSLAGNLEMDASFSGKYYPLKKQVIEKKGNSKIQCNNISFVIPEVTRIQNVVGSIKFDTDTLHFEDFGLEIGTSDFNINGSLSNVFFLLFDIDKNIEGELHIISNTYDFPDFFNYDQRTARSFPYRINDVNLNVGISTSTSNLLDFTVVPEIDFDIQHLDAEIEDFLPPVVISSGNFNLGEIDTALNLNFTDFHINMAGSNLKADVVYNSPRINPDWLNVDVNVADLNPQSTFIHWIKDSISDNLNGLLDGTMHLDLVFSMDTIDFDKLDFTAENLTFINVTDTFDVQQLELVAIDVDYDLTGSNILENLSCEIGLNIKKLSTDVFNVDELDYDIDVDLGAYYIRPNDTHIFNQQGEGLFVLKPFSDKPTFDLKYKVHQFDIENLFSTFLEDTLIVGKMDLDLAISFAGNNREEIEQSLNGKLLISGKDLTLYGLDLDKVIDRFKRSQKFTLADVGAVVLMGPAGILVTKGSDYASLIVLDHGESCEVVEISSDWEVENGLVKLADVAFTTNENRMAAKGLISLLNDSLNIEIGLLNEKGCSVYSQGISGNIKEPHMGRVKLVKSLLAPVTNLVNKVGEVECDVFYDGKVKQPAIK